MNLRQVPGGLNLAGNDLIEISAVICVGPTPNNVIEFHYQSFWNKGCDTKMEREYQKLAKFSLPTGFRGRSAVYVQLWWFVQAVFFKPSPQIMYGWRRWLLRAFGAQIGKSVLIRPSATVTYPWKLKIGDYSWIGDDVILYSLGEIDVGDDVVISQGSYICTGSHKTQLQSFDIYSEKIVIQDQAWIASDVFVFPGVKIGRGAVVAARSTVRCDVDAGVIASGNPASSIGIR